MDAQLMCGHLSEKSTGHQSTGRAKNCTTRGATKFWIRVRATGSELALESVVFVVQMTGDHAVW